MKKMIFSVMLSAIAVIAFSSSASAYSVIRTICDYFCRSSLSGFYNTVLNNTVGSGTFNGTVHSLPGEPITWDEAQAAEFSGSGFNPAIGQYTFSLDGGRPATSRWQANQPGIDFPFSSTVRFNLFVVAGGVTYVSQSAVEVSNPAVQAWPLNNVVHNQVGATPFEQVGVPGIVAFTLSNISATISEHAGPAN